jgi:hypothetical protein
MSIDYTSLCADHSERIAALEDQRETEKACILDIYERLDRLKVQHESNWARIVKLEEANSSAALTGSPAPAGGLVERVADIISNGDDGHHWSDEARAAILAVADWLETQENGFMRSHTQTARWLREEVER